VAHRFRLGKAGQADRRAQVPCQAETALRRALRQINAGGVAEPISKISGSSSISARLPVEGRRAFAVPDGPFRGAIRLR
jgi:hypothetical protein